MSHEAQPKAVYSAIAAVISALATTGITKSRKNTQQGFNFRGIDDVYNALAPLIAKNGLVILPRYTERSMIERVTAKGSPLYYVTVTGELDFVSAADGSIHTVRMYGEAMDTADKATNKAMSAAYKYACLQAFCIPTEADNDEDATTHDPAATRLTDDQLANLEALVGEVNADIAKLLAWLRVDSLESIPAARFAEVVAALERKRAKG